MQRFCARIVASLGFVAGLALAAPLWAAEGGGGGLPQLDARTYPSQIFWLLVSFGLLYWLLKTKAIPRIADILETRQDRINADLDRAARLRAEAEAALKQHDKILADAQADAQRRIREAQEKVAAELARHQAQLDAELAAKLHDAEARIAAAKRAALAEITNVAAEVVQAASRRLAGVEVGAEEARAAVLKVAGEGGR
ncbi:MAG: F0F1 ATP synthase subunit B' [Geminicoccaceae bacterium]|nr:F0F1 ATP synthase subunit B' [Geminicoccaceae bacterium]MCX8099955.1 F0F1 ATP synthase subunit B' [Geminicoccaceae bacterium]